MQLRLSLAALAIITSMSAQAEDFVSIQFLQYDENENRTSVSAPSIMVNKDFGTDYTLNVSLVLDAVSGASRNYYDASSGASAFSRGTNADATDVAYGNVEYSDTRLAGSALLTTRFENRDELTVGISNSTESDFYSHEVSAEYMHWLSSSKNNSITAGVSYQSNQVLRKCPTIGVDGCSGASESMDLTALNAQVSYFQNIDSQSYAKISLFYSNDDGYLSNPYLNVVRNYTEGGTAEIVADTRPDSKIASGVALKYANALTDEIALHLAYRYYSDDWDITSHTLDSDIYYQANADWLFKVGLRSYTQSEAKFYSGEKDYFTNEIYASSDQRLSNFNALTYKTGVDYKIDKDLSVNFDANFYDQSTGLSATYFVTGITYNF